MWINGNSEAGRAEAGPPQDPGPQESKSWGESGYKVAWKYMLIEF